MNTIYNGDIIMGVPVITKLNVNDLEPGKIHRFMFKGADMNIGQSWYVPLFVAKGVKSGKNILINSGIHGDELNGSRVIQRLFTNLDPSTLSGSIIGVVQAAPNSLQHISKNWFLSTDGGDYTNMNRTFPGDKNGDSAHYHAYLLWNNLWKNNVDMAIDLHSQSTDTQYPLFVFADFRNPIAQQMAMLIPANQIKNDEGEPGTVETSFISAGIPAITIEIGAARIYQLDYINQTINGIMNILITFNFLTGKIGKTSMDVNSYIADHMISIKAKCGGYCEILVKLGDLVNVNQLVAIQYNPFGDIIENYYAPVNGKVLSIGDGATRENGGLLVRLLYK